MNYVTFSTDFGDAFPIAILAPKLHVGNMHAEYLEPINLDPKEVIAYEVFKEKKKTSAATIREYLSDLVPYLLDVGAKHLLVGDGDYFKALTGAKKADAYLGYVLENTFPEQHAGAFKVIYVPNYRQVFYDPIKTRAKIQQGLEALHASLHDRYHEPGINILKFSAYPETVVDISAWLQRLLDMDCDLTCDIEGFSLKHYDAGLGTISFSWNQEEGIAFPVDLGEDPVAVRALLLDFFKAFRRNMKYHNASYDVTVLIYQLFMEDLTDYEGLLDGLETLLRDFDDTKIVAYLATNSCAGNELGLKAQSQEYSGNYAQEDIKDIRKIPLPELLQYNLVDAVSTWYVWNKRQPQMLADDQGEIYDTLFKPALIDIIQMQLTGMPLDMEKVLEAKRIFEEDRADIIRIIQAHPKVKEFVYLLDEEHVQKRNSELKTKRIKLGDEPQEFNQNSTPQKQRLFYEMLGFPVIERTDSDLPSTSADTLEKLKAHTSDPKLLELIDAFLEYAAVDKLYGTFIPPMVEAPQGSDGHHYLFGNFNLGGTVSGRLSSSNPNLQTIPSRNNKRGRRNYAKLIKACFCAPQGKVMCGLDFSSLEDRISALTTKDPNKLKTYTEGYDGHCLRAYSYFTERMPDIDPDSVESINTIETRYPDERQDSKGPTFALTYQGTFMTLVAKFGFSTAMAKQIEQRYHELYRVSDEWVQAKLEEASKTGYITAAFGLRVRTPLLAQVIVGNRKTPTEAAAEGRTAGNALGQSWCLLNTRASVEFLRIVRASKYRTRIRPIAHIHDAQYFIIDDDIEVLMFVNQHLVKAVEWQDHPDIWHDTVKLGGELSVFYPSWANEIGIPNGAAKEQILNIIAAKAA
jgi:DNA polymerase-1